MSRMLHQAHVEGKILGLALGWQGEHINKLFFAVDRLLVAREGRNISNFLGHIVLLVAKLFNYQKSSIVFGKKVLCGARRYLLKCCPWMKELWPPFKYFGMVIGMNRVPSTYYEGCVENFRSKMLGLIITNGHEIISLHWYMMINNMCITKYNMCKWWYAIMYDYILRICVAPELLKSRTYKVNTDYWK